MLLDRISGANDIKKISKDQYPALAAEIRQYIVECVSKTGGHLSSSLGVVELTMALHLCMEFPEDKLLWDVGHQAYAHKILTGRKEEFKTLRQLGGISGFPSLEESNCDAFGMGHASTAISAAVGYAKARELSKTKETIVAVIGDGALTGGMAFEALNNCGQLNSNLIIIMNDNEMSISRNVGGVSKILTNMRTGERYIDLKDNVKNKLSKIPNYGDELIDRIHNTKNSIKSVLIPGGVFEDMGITYLGPIDGHDTAKMIRVINAAKKINHPVLIHVRTIKGKGYSYAERRPSFYHGVAPFDVQSGMLLQEKKERTYPDVLASGLNRMAQRDDKIVAVTAAMADGTGLKRFEKKHPDRFIDVGIAEEHAITCAAGMAAKGYKPYVAIYSTFLQRGFDQILHDICIQKLPVRLIAENAGIVGNDGITHQGIFDLSYLGMMPNMTIMAPKNRHEFYKMLEFSLDFDAPLAIRVPKGPATESFSEQDAPIEYGRFEMLRQGKKVAILAVGSMVDTAEQLLPILQAKGIDPTIVNVRFVKPLDQGGLQILAATHDLLVTMEENISTGGFGSSVLNFINEEDVKTKLLRIALPDAFIPHGSRQELLCKYGLDAQSVADRIMKRIQK